MQILQGVFIFAICLPTSRQLPQGLESKTALLSSGKPGRYIPEKFGANGKYVPDDSGKYKHVHMPYNGGYGDRGLNYEHVTPPPPLVQELSKERRLITLGPKDHLRFMIDFNYNGTGFQVIQFAWIQDDEQGDKNLQYNYVYINECCGTENTGYKYEGPVTSKASDSTFYVQAENDRQLNNLIYSEKNSLNEYENTVTL